MTFPDDTDVFDGVGNAMTVEERQDFVRKALGKLRRMFQGCELVIAVGDVGRGDLVMALHAPTHAIACGFVGQIYATVVEQTPVRLTTHGQKTEVPS